ncbi:MAG: MMPL family transporter [Nitrospira sp.]|nr:RND transporter [Candidatus Manganitrophaceae bacterium]HIL33826.1 RND transporter [Candidatus Manganitrophaceae bacterium]
MKRIINHPKTVTFLMIFTTLIFALTAALPSLWPESFPYLHSLHVDTDPENMLPEDEASRVFHNQMKRTFSLNDMIVLGIVNEKHPEGVFNRESLGKIYELTEHAKTLHWPDPERQDEQIGVVEIDLLAPSTVDSMAQEGLGTVKFEWLMPTSPASDAEALAIRRKAERIPFLNGTLLSEDGKAVAVYIPLTSKEVSHKVATALQEKIASFTGDEKYYITGLPIAEETFGIEMFKQMAISAPIAMLIIFILLYFFFKKLSLIISPMIVAVVSVLSTMGLLIATGNTIHIMSSMIPIFIMPIAVLDAIHILSEFFDRYQETKDRKKTILQVMKTLFAPMLYTSLTTAAGFGSLAFTPIPPVRTFGLFIAIGVMLAWFWTITFIPASIMFIKKETLENFGLKKTKNQSTGFLEWVGRMTTDHAKAVLSGTLILTLVAVYGISQIRINDNPIKWFEPSHPIRVADKVLNEHFGGTYMAYLTLEAEEVGTKPDQYANALLRRLTTDAEAVQDLIPFIKEVLQKTGPEVVRLGQAVKSKDVLLDQLEAFAETEMSSASDKAFEAWEEVLFFIDKERQRGEIFKQPKVLAYIADIQEHLLTTGIVGKSNSLSDIVKTVHRELFLGEAKAFRIPDSSNAVAQTLITYQNSHRPQDLWHFVTPDYRTTSLWVQLTSGDNLDMEKVVIAVDQFIEENPPPVSLQHRWFGLTYINGVWQEKMVTGMLYAFVGSFLIVLIMMVILFRSLLWGLLAMVPLTVTIGLIYGVIGLIGKDYDMPVAVLSSLSLGLSVDYAIHFLARSRSLQKEHGSWAKARHAVFGEPARAIVRNAIVVGVGFLPLLAAPLVPYQTVGVFIAAILFTAGVATILILPALIRIMEPWLFPAKQ